MKMKLPDALRHADDLVSAMEYNKAIGILRTCYQVAQKNTLRRLIGERMRAIKMLAAPAAVQTEGDVNYFTGGRETVVPSSKKQSRKGKPTGDEDDGDILDRIGFEDISNSKRYADMYMDDTMRSRLDSALHRAFKVFDKGKGEIRPLLFIGPPGTGKSCTLVAMANELEAKLVMITAAHVKQKLVGESAKTMRDILEAAEARADNRERLIVAFDEAEAIIRPGNSQVTTDVIAVLKSFMENGTGKRPALQVVFCCNSYAVEKALASRCTIIYYPLPGYEQRRQYLHTGIGNYENVGPDIRIEELARATQGCAYRDLKRVLEEADMMRRRCPGHDITKEVTGQLTNGILKRALEHARPLSDGEAKKYQKICLDLGVPYSAPLD